MSVGWLVCAALLWRTSMPAEVDLGGLDTRRYFSAGDVARATRYWRLVEGMRALQVLTGLVALAILARRGPRLARTIGLGRLGTGVIIASVVFVTLWFVSLPFALILHWWAAHHDFAPINLLGLLVAQVQLLIIGGVAVACAVPLLGWLAGRLGDRWWLGASPLFAALAVMFGFANGFLSQGGTHPLRSPAFRADVRRLAQAEGVAGTPVRVAEVGDTRDASAYAYGFGPSANIVVSSTLLHGRFTRPEVRIVLAHELAHVAHRHMLKGLAWTALLAFPVAWLLTAAARRRGGIAEPGSLPFTVPVLALLTVPFVNATSRRYEAEADWAALQATRDPAAARTLYTHLVREYLLQPNPPTWDYLWLQTHPTIAQRIAMAEEWTRTAGRRAPAGS